MNVTGIIAEYNPFHNGHAYQIRQLREKLHSDYVIVVMSGDFVQRGEPAIFDKYCRAHMALLSGADLILELPVLYSTASAPYFAAGGVGILDALGCVDQLSFGTEAGETALFYRIAELLATEPEDFKQALNEYLRQGMSFPAARSKALTMHIPEAAPLLLTPNSILGIEYTKALLSLDSKIRISLLNRKGNGYHSSEIDAYASASAIRKALLSGQTEQIFQAHALPDILRSFYHDSPAFLSSECLSSILGMKLLELSSVDDLSRIFDLSPALANRIFQKRFSYQNFDQFAALLKTKNETLLHIRRSLLHLILSVTQPEEKQIRPSYTRILGMKKDASPLLKKMKETSQIPVITKLADSDAILTSFYREDPEKLLLARKELAQTTFASNLYQMEASRIRSTAFLHENTRRFPVL